MPLFNVQSLYSALAELAFRCEDQAAFRSAWLHRFAQELGVHLAMVCSTSNGKSFASCTINGDSERFQRYAADYMAEIDLNELSRLTGGHAVMDSEVFSAQRREQLRIYREFLAPHGARGYGMRSWLFEGQFFFVLIAKRPSLGGIGDEELRALDALVSVIALGEALHASSKVRPDQRATMLARVTRAEQRVISLAQRGLTNAEIGRLTGTQSRTIRNQLSSIYRKLGVNNRTELAFLFSRLGGDAAGLCKVPSCAIEELLARQTNVA
jgi:DNA-binding CsgD family transcriptional regulator